MNEVWYYEYSVKIWNEIDNCEEILSGVIPSDSLAEAMKELDNYYGDQLIEVRLLKPLFEGPVFEFKAVSEDEECDFIIRKQIKGEPDYADI